MRALVSIDLLIRGMVSTRRFRFSPFYWQHWTTAYQYEGTADDAIENRGLMTWKYWAWGPFEYTRSKWA